MMGVLNLGKIATNFFRIASNIIFGPRRNTCKCVQNIAKRTKGKKILEIGSGKPVGKKYPYSYSNLFSKNNKFIRSDINPKFGHKVIDITKIKSKDEYDLILCLNVLEHVYDFQKGIENIYKLLKKGGEVLVFLPYAYPLHDEPADFFRYSKHALKKMFSKFKSLEIKHFGIKQFPTAYFLVAKK